MNSMSQASRSGQSVEITADAVEGETFTGTVTNVSLQSSYSNGVTNYPVTVTLDDTGKSSSGHERGCEDHSRQL